MTPLGSNYAGGNDAGFFRQMAQRRIGARRPTPMVRPPAMGQPAQPPASMNPPMAPPAMPPPGAPQPPMMPGPPTNGADDSGKRMAAMGFQTYSGSGANMGGGPMENMFMALPQGTEEMFGAAPAGFNDSLRRGGYKGQLPNF